jgi:16S rRNA G966 N2-methylase RsmD
MATPTTCLSTACAHATGTRGVCASLGRTAVECTRDALGDAIGRDVASIATASASPRALILDLFAGSGNTLYWLLRHLPGARAVGFESDAGVFRLTRQNLTALALPIDVVNADYRAGLADVEAGADELVIAFAAPPWGAALDPVAGLDLRRTLPPVAEVVSVLARRFSGHRLLCAVQLYETVQADSLVELNAWFDWSALRVYRLNAPGQNHGIVLGTKGWTPSGDSWGRERG